MPCPFLKEARVKFCDKSAVRKMIRIAGDVARETCSTPAHQECSVYRRFALESPAPQCPYLRESPVQYCSSASVTRFIPFSDSLLSRCTNDSHRFCDVYLSAGAPRSEELPSEKRELSVHGLRVPGWLYYSPNHMWLDVAEGGSWHLGVDALLASVLGPVERITFLTPPGVHRPTAVLRARGVDLEIVFLNPVLLTASNLYLRANPAKLTSDPYGAGWLFEGMVVPGQEAVTSGLIRGDAIRTWMEAEIRRMAALLIGQADAGANDPYMNDGGVFTAEALRRFSHAEILSLFHEFFWGLRTE
ncbi:MAG: hypothetical protein U0Q18_34220 [Bryobacteraceae bacterium]